MRCGNSNHEEKTLILFKLEKNSTHRCVEEIVLSRKKRLFFIYARKNTTHRCVEEKVVVLVKQ
jgi:hypothetical protein